MSLHSWLQDLRSAFAPSRHQSRHRQRGYRRAATHRPNLEILPDRCVPAVYAVTELGTLGGAFSLTSDLNEAGQAVGHARTADGSDHAFLWNRGTTIDLGTLGGSYSYAEGINDLGQVVGNAAVPGDGTQHAFLVTPQGGVWFQDNNLDGLNDFMIDLGTLEVNRSGATDINNAGQVVGWSGGHAFLWDAVNGMTDLGVPPGFTDSYPEGINEAGQVTGSASDALSGHESAFLWDAATGMTALGAGPDYTDSHATALNDAGQVVGYQWNAADQTNYAFLWTPDSPNGLGGSFTGLGVLPFGIDSSATDINSAGQVVGSSTVEESNLFDTFYEPHAFLWDAAGGMRDLQNQLLAGSGATLESARAVSDGGTIAANGYTGSGAYLLTPIPPDTPLIRIADAPAVTEGNSGTRSATFTVTLSAASSQTVTVNYATGNGTAAAGGDYLATSGTLRFAPGQTSMTITVSVLGDRLPEPNETFVVNLSSPTNAIIADGQGAGTILDDEPRISIRDATVREGNGGTRSMTFTVTLSAAYDQPVTVHFATTDGTATASDNDYAATSGTLTFAPGQTVQTVTVTIKGDKKKEADESFYLDLFDSSGNSLITKSRGTGTILNDD
jgi:probable HAF family extracellular repeat protein